jgi:hypothetical protein
MKNRSDPEAATAAKVSSQGIEVVFDDVAPDTPFRIVAFIDCNDGLEPLTTSENAKPIYPFYPMTGRRCALVQPMMNIRHSGAMKVLLIIAFHTFRFCYRGDTIEMSY